MPPPKIGLPAASSSLCIAELPSTMRKARNVRATLLLFQNGQFQCSSSLPNAEKPSILPCIDGHPMEIDEAKKSKWQMSLPLQGAHDFRGSGALLSRGAQTHFIYLFFKMGITLITVFIMRVLDPSLSALQNGYPLHPPK